MEIGQPKLSERAIQSRGDVSKLFKELWGGYKGRQPIFFKVLKLQDGSDFLIQ